MSSGRGHLEEEILELARGPIGAPPTTTVDAADGVQSGGHTPDKSVGAAGGRVDPVTEATDAHGTRSGKQIGRKCVHFVDPGKRRYPFAGPSFHRGGGVQLRQAASRKGAPEPDAPFSFEQLAQMITASSE